MTRLSTEKQAQMIWLAVTARDNAYAPYSHHPVGVALLAESGAIYVGANNEAANYDVTCAEVAAISAMVTAGERKIRAMVVAGPAEGETLCMPCGRCRQRIYEFSDAQTRIYVLKPDGSVGRICTLAQLLPHGFGPADMSYLQATPHKPQIKPKTKTKTKANTKANTKAAGKRQPPRRRKG